MSASPNPLPSATASANADGAAGFVADITAVAATLPGAHHHTHSHSPHEHAPHNADAPGSCCGGCANQLNCSKAQAWHQE